MTNIPEQSRDGLLASCPFCGVEGRASMRGMNKQAVVLECGNRDCRVLVQTDPGTHIEAIKRWNTRALTPEQISPLSDGVVTEVMVDAGVKFYMDAPDEGFDDTQLFGGIYLAMSALSRPSLEPTLGSHTEGGSGADPAFVASQSSQQAVSPVPASIRAKE